MAARHGGESGRSKEELRDEINGLLPREPHGHARLSQRVHEMEDVGRSAADKGHEGVEFLFRQHDGLADERKEVQHHAENRLRQLRVFLNGEDARAYESRGVGHDPHHMATVLHHLAQVPQQWR